MHAFERSDLLLLKFVWLPIDVLVAGRFGSYLRFPFRFPDLGSLLICFGCNFDGRGVVEFVGTLFFLERFAPETSLERFVPELVFGTIYPRGCLYGIAYSVQRMTDGV